MAASNGVTREQFKSSFSDLGPLILGEWPELDKKSLDGTDGDYEKVVELVAKATERTKTLVKKQLDELSQMAKADSTDSRIHRMLANLEAKTHEISGFVRQNMLPNAEQKVRDHLLVSMLVTTCIGFLLGFIFRGFGRGR